MGFSVTYHYPARCSIFTCDNGKQCVLAWFCIEEGGWSCLDKGIIVCCSWSKDELEAQQDVKEIMKVGLNMEDVFC